MLTLSKLCALNICYLVYVSYSSVKLFKKRQIQVQITNERKARRKRKEGREERKNEVKEEEREGRHKTNRGGCA